MEQEELRNTIRVELRDLRGTGPATFGTATTIPMAGGKR